MEDRLLYFPILPDPAKPGANRVDDARRWVENFLLPSKLATLNEDEANAYLVVGGDGKLMKTVREKIDRGKLFFGINRGTIGFLLNPISDINQIPQVASQVNIVSIRLMEVTFIDQAGNEKKFLAFNDAFCGGNIADYVTFTIGGSLTHFPSRTVKGNGVIISTPQGTTSYALKARGSAAVLPLDTGSWFISGIATGPYPCDQVNPQKITVTVKSRRPVNGYADGYEQEVKDIAQMIVRPNGHTANLGFVTNLDFAARRTQLAQQLERGE